MKRAARQAGYEFGVATNSGPIRFDEDLLEIRRVHILPWTDAFQFWKRSSPWYFRYKTMKGNLPQHQAPQPAASRHAAAGMADADEVPARHELAAMR